MVSKNSSRIVLAAALAAAVFAGSAITAPFSQAAAPATAPATQPGGDVLESKGLSKSGTFFILNAEHELADGMREMTKAKKKMDEDNKKRAVFDREIARANGAYGQFDQERRAELEKLAKAKEAFQHNQIIAKIEVLEANMKEAVEYKEAQQKSLGALGDDTRAKYISTVLDLATLADKTNEDYAALAKNTEVTSAVAGQKGKLGPTPEFLAQFNQLKRARSPILSETIKVEYEGKVPYVEVTLNGTTIKKMVLDSGASLVVIPADLAKAMELIPAKDDPEITLQLADGKQVQARQTKLKSVRVGKFILENVDCAVLPAELVAAEALLGGSFLNSYTYKLDSGKEELHMAKIGSDAPAVKKPAAGAAAGSK